jgi:hypothetical protein
MGIQFRSLGKKLREFQFFVRVLAFPILGKTKGQIFEKIWPSSKLKKRNEKLSLVEKE